MSNAFLLTNSLAVAVTMVAQIVHGEDRAELKAKDWTKMDHEEAYAYGDFYNTVSRPYFIDKSLFIQDYLDGNITALAITAPARFGKTTHLAMLKHFLQIPVYRNGTVMKKENSKAYNLFKGLKIGSTKSFELMGTLAVISFDFKGLTGFQTFKEFLYCFRNVIMLAFKQHGYLEDSMPTEVLIQRARHYFKKCFYNISSIKDEVELQDTLPACGEHLADMMHDYYGKPVFIQLDESSVPFNHMLSLPIQSVCWTRGKPGLLTDVTVFLGKFVSRLFKDYPYLWRGLMTGIMRYGETYTEYANNLVYHSIFEETKLMENYGFTEADVTYICKKLKVSPEEQEKIKSFFDGYSPYNDESYTGGVYSPGYVIKYLQEHRGQLVTPKRAGLYCPASVLDVFDNLLAQGNFGNEILHSLDAEKTVSIDDPIYLTFESLVNLRRAELGVNSEPQSVKDGFFYYLLENGLYSARRISGRLKLHIPNKMMKISLQDRIVKFKYFSDFIAGSSFERREFRILFTTIKGEEHKADALTNSIGKLFWGGVYKTPERKYELAAPIYAVLAEGSGNERVHGELRVSSPEGSHWVKPRNKWINSTAGGRIDMLAIGEDFWIIFESTVDWPGQKQAKSSPEKALQYILDNDYPRILPRIGIKKFVLIGVHMNQTHCGCCILDNTTDMSKRVCAVVAKAQFQTGSKGSTYPDMRSIALGKYPPVTTTHSPT